MSCAELLDANIELGDHIDPGDAALQRRELEAFVDASRGTFRLSTCGALAATLD